MKMNKKLTIKLVALLMIVAMLVVGLYNSFPGSTTDPVSNLKSSLTLTSVSAAGTADVTADGTSDDVDLQDLIDDLPAAGGRVEVLSGTYSWDALATVTRAINNVTIDGTGYGTYVDSDGITAPITAGGNNWVISNMRFDSPGPNMGATTGWVWINVWVGATHYDYRNATNSITDGTVTATTANITTLNAPTGRGATYVVAASDAPEHVKAQADYVSSGGDDGVLLNNAVAACPASGGTIWLSTGTFEISTTWTINKSITVVGAGNGGAITSGVTIIKQANSANLARIINATGNDVNIRDIYVNGNTANNTDGIGIFIGGANSSIENCFIRNCQSFSVQTAGYAGYFKHVFCEYGEATAWKDTGHDNRFVACHGSQCKGATTDGFSTTGYAARYEMCVAANVGRDGWNLEAGSYGSTIINCWLAGGFGTTGGAARNAVTIAGSSYNIIKGNIFEDMSQSVDNTYDGIWITNSSTGAFSNNNIISGNIIRTVAAAGIKTYKYGVDITAGNIGNIVNANQIIGASTLPVYDLGTLTINERNGNYVAPGEIRPYSGSLIAGTVGNAIMAWQNPHSQAMMVTGRTLITTGATAAATGDWGLATTVNVVNDGETTWTAGTHGTAAVNTIYANRGTNCNAITIAAGIANGDKIAYQDSVAQDDSTATHLTFKFRSTAALNAGDVAIMLDEDSACASPSYTLNLPAIGANSTTLICLPINAGAAAGATVDALLSVGLQVVDNTRAVAGTIFYIDDIRAITVGTDLVNDANLQTTGIANYSTPIHLDYKNNDDATHHDTLVMVSAANDSTGLDGSWYVTVQGE